MLAWRWRLDEPQVGSYKLHLDPAAEAAKAAEAAEAAAEAATEAAEDDAAAGAAKKKKKKKKKKKGGAASGLLSYFGGVVSDRSWEQASVSFVRPPDQVTNQVAVAGPRQKGWPSRSMAAAAVSPFRRQCGRCRPNGPGIPTRAMPAAHRTTPHTSCAV